MGGSPMNLVVTPSTLNSGATGADIAKNVVDPSTGDAYSWYTDGVWRVAKKEISYENERRLVFTRKKSVMTIT